MEKPVRTKGIFRGSDIHLSQSPIWKEKPGNSFFSQPSPAAFPKRFPIEDVTMTKRRARFQTDQWLLIKICNLVGTGEITGIKIRDGKLYFPAGARYMREVDFSLNPNEPPKFRMNRLMKHLGRVNGEEANIIFQEHKPQKVILSGSISQLISTFIPAEKVDGAI